MAVTDLGGFGPHPSTGNAPVLTKTQQGRKGNPMKTTTRYTWRTLLTLLASLAKPATDAVAAEFGTRSAAAEVPALAPAPNPGRKVVGQVASPAAIVEPAPAFVPENATALNLSGATVPSIAPWLDVAPLGKKPARKPSTRKPAPARDATGTHGTLNWQAGQERGSGVVAIAAGRSTCRYAVVETPTDWNGRAFRLEKLDAGSDPESRSYSVFVCNNGRDHRCDCKGFEAGKGKPCRHVNALKALAATCRV